MTNCYCCSGREYENCCQPFLTGNARPETAEELMRSRYSAYVIADVEYLLRSTHPSTRKYCDAESIRQWAETSKWQKLEIESVTGGGAKDKQGIVVFKAYYLDANQNLQIHHERSNFLKELGKWFFVNGKVVETLD